MKISAAALLFSFFCLVPGISSACGTLPEPEERKFDEANLQRERELALETAKRSHLVLIGTVSSLRRPEFKSQGPGLVTLQVTQVLKGSTTDELSLPWRESGMFSCVPSDMFLNVGFRENWEYIVYIADGKILRSDATNRTAYRFSLGLAEERSIVLSASGTR